MIDKALERKITLEEYELRKMANRKQKDIHIDMKLSKEATQRTLFIGRMLIGVGVMDGVTLKERFQAWNFPCKRKTPL